MLVIQIDGIDAQPPQTGFTARANILRPTIDAAPGWIIGVTHDAEFSGQERSIPLALERSADQLLMSKRPIDIGGIEQGNACLLYTSFEGRLPL